MTMIDDIPFPELDGLLARFYLGMVEEISSDFTIVSPSLYSLTLYL
jgi:hypothetical protein